LAREEIVSVNPEDAHRALREHRKHKAELKANWLKIEGEKHRCAITEANAPLLRAVLRILEENLDYWPHTVRQIHYNLLNSPPLTHASKPTSTYRNDLNSYQKAVDIITRAR
jgi:hypothetical protein